MACVKKDGEKSYLRSVICAVLLYFTSVDLYLQQMSINVICYTK